MKLPSESEVKKIVDEWEKTIWKDLYKGAGTLEERLAIISEKLQLELMPFLKTKEEKIEYLIELEDIYYEKVFCQCHDYGPV